MKKDKPIINKLIFTLIIFKNNKNRHRKNINNTITPPLYINSAPEPIAKPPNFNKPVISFEFNHI